MRLRATPQRRIETSGYISGHYRHAPSPRLSAARGIVIHRLNLHSPLPRAGRRVRVGTRFRRAASAQKFTSINFSAGPPVHRSLTERHPVPGGRERGKGSAAAGPFPFFSCREGTRRDIFLSEQARKAAFPARTKGGRPYQRPFTRPLISSLLSTNLPSPRTGDSFPAHFPTLLLRLPSPRPAR